MSGRCQLECAPIGGRCSGSSYSRVPRGAPQILSSGQPCFTRRQLNHHDNYDGAHSDYNDDDDECAHTNYNDDDASSDYNDDDDASSDYNDDCGIISWFNRAIAGDRAPTRRRLKDG
jgi:hypothetical protein